MNVDTFKVEGNRFRIGTIECAIASDGFFAYRHPDKILFANAPADELQSALADTGIELSAWETYLSPYPSLLVDTGAKKILVDTGAGSLGPETGQLVDSLDALGVSVDDIDTVVLTHIHPDHVGGALNEQGQPRFPNARYVCSETEWQFWMNSPDLATLPLPDDFRAMLLDCATSSLTGLRDVIDRIPSDATICDGVQAFCAAGHTPGQIGVRIESSDEVLMAVADAIVHPLHVRYPDWCTAVDYSPDTAVASRRRILAQATSEQALVFAFHFPAPGLGFIDEADGQWIWRSVN